jgi:RHS repeat-associated protein
MRFALIVFLSVIALMTASSARAQVQTYSYQGQSFNPANCVDGPPDYTFQGGTVTGQVTFQGLAPGYSGTIASPSSNVASLSFTGPSSGTLDLSSYSPSYAFLLSSGQITSWGATLAINNGTNEWQVSTSGTVGSTGNDFNQFETTPFHINWGCNTLLGQWSNPKSSGIACAEQAPADSRPPPGQAACAAPINIGVGNMYEWKQDYSTVGQNPLPFIRYYNSMSAPDTYAVALGSNWRHNFDRYLHIVNPSAVYGAIAERADGQYVTFSSSSGTYTSDSDLDYGLTRGGSGPSWTWTLTDPDDTVETYSQSGAEATLSSIKLRNGYTQTMHYTTGKLTSVTDTYGRTLGLSYSSVGLLASVTTPDTPTLAYGYVGFSSGGHLLSTVTYNTSPSTQIQYAYGNTSFPAALTGITDENGHSTATWTYDSTGRAVSSQLAGGIKYTSVSYYDTSGDRKVTGPLGINETYKFSMLQGVPKVTEIDRAANGTVTFSSRHFTYDSNGYLKTATDWNGNQTAYTNNSHGLPTQIVYASGNAVSHTTSITYDTTWARLAHVVTQPDVTSTLNYSGTNGTLLTRVLADTTSTSVPYSTNGQSRTWTMTYTSSGQLSTLQLPRTDLTAKTTYTYTGGVLTNIKDALNHNTRIVTYKPGGLPLTVRDPNNTLTTLAYNPRLWLTSAVMTTSAGTLTTTPRYDSAGNLTRLTVPDGSYLNYTYNDAHQPITVLNRANQTENITYNSAGNITQVLWKTSGGTTTRQHSATFDALGRMLTDVGGVSQTTTYGYDSNGNVTSITDPLSHATARTFDALNRLKTTINAVHDLVQFAYDAHDRPLTVTDGKGNATNFVYDGFGDAIQQASPDSGTTVWFYDPDSNATGRVQAGVNYSSATYDALDRPLTRTYPADSTLNVTYVWDQTTGHGTGIGNLTSVTADQAGSLSLSYDQRNLVTSNARTVGATTYTTGYTYESAGRLASVTYPTAGWTVNYARNSAGEVSSMTVKPPSTSAVNLATSITHLPFGPVSGFFYGNGVHDTRTFDLDYRMTSVKDVGTGNIQYQSYGYDAANNPTSITDNVTSGNSQTLTYDAVDRLKSAVGSYGTVSSITYDSNSNRKTYGGLSYTVPSGSDKMSAVGASAITYSSTGNMAAVGATTTMAYNKANQLGTITISGTSTVYTYGASGYRLTAKTGTNTMSIYQYGQNGELLAENRSTTDTDYAYLDGMPISIIQPSTSAISAIHTDRLGTPQKATDSTKTLNWALLMNPNGGGSPSPSTAPINLRWPGQHGDATGYFDNGYRAYMPITIGGRYLENDLIGLRGGLNPYVYAGNNPYANMDPRGLCLEDLCIGETIITIEIAEALSAEASFILEGSAAEGFAAEGAVGLPFAAPLAGAPTETPTMPGEVCRPPEPATPVVNTNPYAGAVDQPVFVVDPYGNIIPVQEGEYIGASPNGNYQQVYGANLRPTGLRLDRGGHPTQWDPAAQVPHGHVPGITINGNPHLPVYFQ